MRWFHCIFNVYICSVVRPDIFYLQCAAYGVRLCNTALDLQAHSSLKLKVLPFENDMKIESIGKEYEI